MELAPDIFVLGDPYLAYQPDFSKSLPVQLFVNGVTMTLLIVLLLHLLFTTQYHYPLAPLNYSLQLISILVVFLSVIVKVWAILWECRTHASSWPYDLDYISVELPPSPWTTAQKAAWWLLQALNNAFANITHIQFLTLLYPSRVEARLIIFILGPLAIASSGLVFTALSGSQKVIDISDSIRNILDSTLLLIFTIALVIWGFLVNRRRAWRTDGGTAVFGVGSLLLAVVSTSGNFIAVAEDGIEWLQHLLFAAILWQTWLGWWWWVGSGMGIGEVEDLMERAEKKKRKLARRAARQRANAAASGQTRQPLYRHSSFAGLVDAGQASAQAMVGFTSSVTSILRNRSGTLSRRHRTMSGQGDIENGEGAVELDNLGSSPTAQHSISLDDNRGPGSVDNGHLPSSPSRVGFSTSRGQEPPTRLETSNSETSSTSATPSLHPPKSVGQLLSFPTTWLQIYMRRLTKAHQEAARKQVLQKADLRREVFEPHRAAAVGQETLSLDAEIPSRPVVGPLSGEDDGVGWGLGRFGIKEHQESAKRLQEARERLQEERLLGSTSAGPSATRDEEPSTAGPSKRSKDPVQRVMGSNARRAGKGKKPHAEDVAGSESLLGSGLAGSPSAQRAPAPDADDPDGDGQWEDVDATASSSSSSEPRGHKGKGKKPVSGNNRGGGGTGAGGGGGGGPSRGGGGSRESGWSWWGPLKEWRLADRSSF
ncbi:hypothetical protein BD324DRAFT_655690 [Kockovaella imperatae]|uniref:Uncharacterized protein n=1 Tax=Kockovaella imperatae TaxID=4999 RepID=A0A1Y1UMG4_9TREE|nr:hypothetical protein BD324DRAFT_655690 [Kockovaella imperatae]ORX38325.1 hypothetical protein BD324DRAFT_655690 [Kockovaella imperatae]